MASDTISRPALGRTAALGDLYNARSETFKNLQIFKKFPIPKNCTATIDNPLNDLQFLKTEKFSEKFSKFNISADFTLSLIAGLVPVAGGAGKYLQEEKESARAATTTLMYSVRTKTDTLNIYNDDLVEYISGEAIMDTDATHVVVRIDWGANVFISFEDKSGGDGSVRDLSSNLEAKFKFGLSVKNDTDFAGKNLGEDGSISLRVYGDISMESGKIPQTASDAHEFLASVPKLIQNSNNGKGKAIVYGMVPICVFQKRFCQVIKTPLWSELADDIGRRVVNFFDGLLELKQQLRDLIEDIREHQFCLTEQNVQQVQKKEKDLALIELFAKSRLKTELEKLRTGHATTQDFEHFIGEMDDSLVKEGNVMKEMKQLHDIKKYLDSKGGLANLIRLVKALLKEGILPIGTDGATSIQNIVNGNPGNKKQFIYAFNTKHVENDEDVMTNHQFFLQLLISHPESAKFYFVNTDLHPIPYGAKNQQKNVSVYYFSKGEFKSDDWCAETEKLLKIPIVGSYTLKDNGNFGVYLTALGVWGVQYYAILSSWSTVVIKKEDANDMYKLEINNTLKNVSQTFKLNRVFSELTLDGKNVQSVYTRDLNKLILKQKLQDGKERITIREFTENQMTVKLILDPKANTKEETITALRIYQRNE